MKTIRFAHAALHEDAPLPPTEAAYMTAEFDAALREERMVTLEYTVPTALIQQWERELETARTTYEREMEAAAVASYEQYVIEWVEYPPYRATTRPLFLDWLRSRFGKKRK